MSKRRLLLIYDDECPVCRNFVQAVRIRETVGELVLINAREDHAAVRQLTARNFDLDQGMALIIGANVYYGAEVVRMLAMLGSRSGFFNRLNYWVFRSPARTRFLYPILRAGRHLLLRILGRPKINGPGSDSNNATVEHE